MCVFVISDHTLNSSHLLLTPGVTVISTPDFPEIGRLEHTDERVSLTEGLKQLVGTYWVLMVVVAFLLVLMLGDPGLLKTVYLIFFFYFMITYQVQSIAVYIMVYVTCTTVQYSM